MSNTSRTEKDPFGDGYTTWNPDGTYSRTEKDFLGDGYTTTYHDGTYSRTEKDFLGDGYTTTHFGGSSGTGGGGARRSPDVRIEDLAVSVGIGAVSLIISLFFPFKVLAMQGRLFFPLFLIAAATLGMRAARKHIGYGAATCWTNVAYLVAFTAMMDGVLSAKGNAGIAVICMLWVACLVPSFVTPYLMGAPFLTALMYLVPFLFVYFQEFSIHHGPSSAQKAVNVILALAVAYAVASTARYVMAKAEGRVSEDGEILPRKSA